MSETSQAMSETSQTLDYHVDLMLCIDGTWSMEYVIDGVKSYASDLHNNIISALDKEGKRVEKLRVGVIVFRDFAVDGEKGLEVLPFKSIPDEEEVVKAFIQSIKESGGGDEPENGLEALGVAFRQDWTTEGARRRHIILLFTDAEPHPYKTVTGPAMPTDIPESMDDLIMDYAGGTQRPGRKLNDTAKRLVLFAPAGGTWEEKFGSLDLVALQPLDVMLSNAEASRKGLEQAIVKSV